MASAMAALVAAAAAAAAAVRPAKEDKKLTDADEFQKRNHADYWIFACGC